MRSPSFMIAPTYAQKLTLIASVPLVLAVTAIAFVVALQARAVADREISTLEQQLLDAKKVELRNYVTQARNGFYFVYGSASPDDGAAKSQVAQILAAMIYGEEGQFFVYDYDGTALVSPRQTDRINRNFAGETDSDGTPVVDELIRIARSGGGYHTYMWPKPSTGEDAQMITYVTSFPSWQWAVGTGVFIDDVLASGAAARSDVQARVQRTFFYIGVITVTALLLVFGTGMLVNLRERRLADAKLKKLTQRVFDAQEEERGRVARELHDGISQILVGVRYALDNARRRLERGDARAAEPLAKGIDSLAQAIAEVRRISRDLRPSIPDDDEAKIALYRIAQEALTNIERHARATEVVVDLRGHRQGATLSISDNGLGLAKTRSTAGGLGLRNMQERIEQLDGTLTMQTSAQGGTEITATVPLTHMLRPPPTALP